MLARMPATASSLKYWRRYMYSMINWSSTMTIRSIGKSVRPEPPTSPNCRLSSFHSRRVRSRGWFSNTMMLSNSGWPLRPAQRWISPSAVYSWSRSSRLMRCNCCSHCPTCACGSTS
ncbi:hypothetical protein D3C81_723240 [compost metagenome]